MVEKKYGREIRENMAEAKVRGRKHEKRRNISEKLPFSEISKEKNVG